MATTRTPQADSLGVSALERAAAREKKFRAAARPGLIDRAVEEEWAAFADDCRFGERDISLGDLMTLAIKEHCNASEGFLTVSTDLDVSHKVKLRLQPIAPERVRTPYGKERKAAGRPHALAGAPKKSRKTRISPCPFGIPVDKMRVRCR